MKTRNQKREEAFKRQEEYNKLTPAEKTSRLDYKLGSGIGAIKERSKLLQKDKP
jgi:hypothetical protein